MTKRVLLFVAVICMLSFATVSAERIALLPGTDRCPPYVGEFHILRTGLVVTISKEDDKAVSSHTEQLANPLSGLEAKAVAGRGTVQFNAHVDRATGRLFVHWESVRSLR